MRRGMMRGRWTAEAYRVVYLTAEEYVVYLTAEEYLEMLFRNDGSFVRVDEYGTEWPVPIIAGEMGTWRDPEDGHHRHVFLEDREP